MLHHPELPLFAFLSLTLLLIPTIRHWKSQNIAIHALIFWLLLANIVNAVNAIVWDGNERNPIPVWCDITTKILLGSSYAISLSMLCISKHLAMTSSPRKMHSPKDNRQRIVFEGIVCLGAPLIFVTLHYVVQDHRYDIFENTGCQAAIYVSAPAVLIIWLPRLLVSVITLMYSSLALHQFVRRRLTFANHLQLPTTSVLTTNHYLRLLTLAFTETFWLITATSYSLSNSVSGGLRPWTSWADVHSNFSTVGVFRTQDLSSQRIRSVALAWWIGPVSSLILFACFGFGKDAVNEYNKIWTRFTSAILRRSTRDKQKVPSVIGPLGRRGSKPLHFVSLGTNSSSSSSKLDSPSHDYTLKSPPLLTSHVSHSSSASSATLIRHNDGKKAELLRAQKAAQWQYIPEPAPSYYPPETTHQRDIALPIVSRRMSPPHFGNITMAPRSPSFPDLDGSDTFTLSTFSYYGGAMPSTMTDPLRSPALSMFAPEPAIEVEPVSLPPPPRRRPRHMGSNKSVNSATTIVAGVPEDVGSASFEQRGVLGISGGGIFITVEREEQTDGHI